MRYQHSVLGLYNWLQKRSRYGGRNAHEFELLNMNNLKPCIGKTEIHLIW